MQYFANNVDSKHIFAPEHGPNAMFRNPRENAARNADALLKPSVGRPPSPHTSPKPPIVSTPTAKSKSEIATKLAIPTAPARTPKQPVAQRKAASTTKSTVKKVPQNGNILSFFKKVGDEEYESLFMADTPRKPGLANVPASARTARLESPEKIDLPEAEEDNLSRYNEDCTSNKRRKLSHSSNKDATDNQQKGGTQAETSEVKGCIPPPHDFNGQIGLETWNGGSINRELEKRRNIGPFLDDSDSEDESLPQRRRSTVVAQEAVRRSVDDGSPSGHESPSKMNENEKEGDFAEQRSPFSLQDPRPGLRREETSYAEQDGFADFEGMEDFDDEYVEGEEFVERRWMQWQRSAEMGDDDFEGEVEDGDLADAADDVNLEMKEEPGDDIAAQTVSSISACPVCAVSFEGISDQGVSVHVNHCLDGNPSPLPLPERASKADPEIKAEPQSSAANYRHPVRPAKPGQENPFTLGSAKGTSSAFSKLMSGHAEDAAWATAAAAEHASRGKPAFQRTCPFYKILPGFFICVDAFRYGAVQGCNAYFLSHFHSDHYIGLTGTWSHGPIYCSRPTANLVKQQLRVDSKWVVPLEFEKKVQVPGTEGVYVTMIPANHCPGSSLYLFEKIIANGKNPKVQRVLHCGDFRACPAHVEHPLLRPDIMDAVTGKTAQQKIDVCYLDTTYLNPKYAFPSQEDVIEACADMCVSLNKDKPDCEDVWEQMNKERAGTAMAKFVRSDSKQVETVDPTSINTSNSSKRPRGRLLVVVGTYSIGKERICLGIARALKSKIYAPPGKQRICGALEDPELNAILTSDPRDAQVHMTPLFEIRAETLGDYLAEYGDRFTRCVGFRPSGWNYRPPGSRFTESPAISTVLYSDNWKSGYSMRDLVPQRGSTSKAKCFGVPYSEHSSFRELSMFCCALRIEKIVPTVNVGSAKGRERMKVWCERWAAERKKNGLFKVDRKEGGGNAWYPGKGTWELRTTL